MSINPKVKKDLKGVNNLEVKRLILTTYRHDSQLGKGLADAINFERATGDVIGKDFKIESGPIEGQRVVSVICELFPDFDKECLLYLNSIPEEERVARVVFQRLAFFIADRYLVGKHQDFETFFTLIETLLSDGESSLKMLVGGSFLEDLQNMIGNQDIDPNVLIKYFGPETLKWWNEVNRFWANLEDYYNKVSG